MRRLVYPLVLAVAAAIIPWQAGTGSADGLTFGNVVSAINQTRTVVATLPSSVLTVSVVDVNQITPGDPCRRSLLGDPCWPPAYYNAIGRNAAAILSLRSALGGVHSTGCSTDLTCSVGLSLYEQNVSMNTVVAATIANAQLLVYYDSNPTDCVTSPSSTSCIPPSPI